MKMQCRVLSAPKRASARSLQRCPPARIAPAADGAAPAAQQLCSSCARPVVMLLVYGVAAGTTASNHGSLHIVYPSCTITTFITTSSGPAALAARGGRPGARCLCRDGDPWHVSSAPRIPLLYAPARSPAHSLTARRVLSPGHTHNGSALRGCFAGHACPRKAVEGLARCSFSIHRPITWTLSRREAGVGRADFAVWLPKSALPPCRHLLPCPPPAVGSQSRRAALSTDGSAVDDLRCHLWEEGRAEKKANEANPWCCIGNYAQIGWSLDM